MVTAVFPAAGASKRMGDFCGINKNCNVTLHPVSAI